MSEGELGIIKTVFQYGWPLAVGLVTWFWKQNEKKQEEVRTQNKEDIAVLQKEMDTQRKNIAKLFDQDTEIRRDAEQRHIDLMKEIAAAQRK